MVISHNLGEMGRCLAIVTWLKLLPHQSNEEMYTCQQHEVKSREDIIFAYCIDCCVHHPCLAQAGT